MCLELSMSLVRRLTVIAVLACRMPFACAAAESADSNSPATETIAIIRHGEKPAGDLGQLAPAGLARALALPPVLIQKFGPADFIFAPLTTQKINADGRGFSYIRPLATIEPTAIKLGLPVDTRFPYSDIEGLQNELLTPKYRGSTIYVAWEHHLAEKLVKDLIQSFHQETREIPEWNDSDFDSIYVIRISTTADGRRDISFQHDHEGLNAPAANAEAVDKK